MGHTLKIWLPVTFGVAIFFHTFLESRHPGLPEKSGWTCQSGSFRGICVALASRCQILANALDDIKYHIPTTSKDIWTN